MGKKYRESAGRSISDTMVDLDAHHGEVMAKVGEDELEMSKEQFTLKLQEKDVTIVAMRASLDCYLATLKRVYDRRIIGELAIAEAMRKERMRPKDLMKEQRKILKLKKDYLTAAKTGFRKYYDALASQHAKVTVLLKEKTSELKKMKGGTPDGKSQC